MSFLLDAVAKLMPSGSPERFNIKYLYDKWLLKVEGIDASQYPARIPLFEKMGVTLLGEFATYNMV